MMLRPWPLTLAALTLATVSVAGCVSRQPAEEVEVASEPLVYDPAMRIRDWPRTTTFYLGGGTEAGPVYFPFAPAGSVVDETSSDDSSVGGLARLTDGVFFVANAVVLPFQMIVNPPVAKEAYEPGEVPPTFHAVPPMEGRRAVHPATPSTRPATRPGTVRVYLPKPEAKPSPAVEPATKPTTVRVLLPRR